MPDDTFDVIVVGAGTSGSILASRIAENGLNPGTGDRLKVALFEGGPYYLKGGPLRPGVGDPTRRRLITNIRSDETEPPHWFYDGFNVKAVGGCSLHWGSNASIPIPKDFANWERETGSGWTEETFKDAIDEAVRMYHVNHTPLTIPPESRKPRMSKGGQMFADAARGMGLKVNEPEDPREKAPRGLGRVNCINCGYCGRGHYCKYDSKVGGLYYLKMIGEENGLEVIPDCEVDHVILEKTGSSYVAKGIAYTQKGVKKQARAARVIVSCGTNGSPLLLYRSGYGPKDFLGANLLVENNNVGRHLDGDLSGGALDILLRFAEDIHEGAELGGRGGGSGSNLLVHEQGDRNKLTLSGVSPVALQNQYPDLLALYPVAPDFGMEHKEYMRRAVKRLGVIGFTLRAFIWDKGRIGMRGEHLYRRDDPDVLNQFLDNWHVAQDIVKKLNPQPVKVDDKPPRSFAILHEVGTCRAGISKENSVVTPDFDSHDIGNLMICSAAAVPSGCFTNSHMPTVSVSSHAWRRIVANHFTRGAAPLKI